MKLQHLKKFDAHPPSNSKVLFFQEGSLYSWDFHSYPSEWCPWDLFNALMWARMVRLCIWNWHIVFNFRNSKSGHCNVRRANTEVSALTMSIVRKLKKKKKKRQFWIFFSQILGCKEMYIQVRLQNMKR